MTLNDGLFVELAVGDAHVQFVAGVESTHQAGAGQVQVVADGHHVTGVVGGGHYGYQHHFVPVFIHNTSVAVLFADALGDELRQVVEGVGVVVAVIRCQIRSLVVGHLVLFEEGVHVLLAHHQYGLWCRDRACPAYLGRYVLRQG